MEVVLFKYVNVNVIGYGKVGEFLLVIKDNININVFLGLDVKIEVVMMIDNFVMVYLVVIKVGEVIFFNGNVGLNCFDIIDFVCGSNGVIYINSCYVEVVGIIEYISGVCFFDCIDLVKINFDVVCIIDYDFVCGCNGVIYMNVCVVDVVGVINYIVGFCSDNNGCYDLVYVVINLGINVNYIDGVIMVSCDDYEELVCGCNGVIYMNFCYVEVSGIIFYI